MVPKGGLLIDLKGFLEFEEGIIDELAAIYKSLGARGKLDDECFSRITQELQVMKLDSQKHAGLVKEMIKHIESCGKDEF